MERSIKIFELMESTIKGGHVGDYIDDKSVYSSRSYYDVELEKKRLENFGHSNKFYDIKDKIISGTQLSKFMELYVPRLEHIVNIEDVEKIRDTCGYIRELYVDNTMSLAYVNLSGKAKEHKHNVMQEVYYIIKGNGTITINEKTEDIWRGDLITIPKNSWHYLTGRGELELLVVTSPRFDPKDVILK